MDPKRLRELLQSVQSGALDVNGAIDALKTLPFADLGYARVDHHRALRSGIPEVILGEGKTVQQIEGIARELITSGQRLLVTRVEPEQALAVSLALPELRHVPVARVLTFGHELVEPYETEPVAVVTAGTSDIPVAEEALETLLMCGIPAQRVFDVGVAGIHRIVKSLDTINKAPAVIVVAGMEGALPSVVGGLLGTPVIAVPTSIGYGAAMGGLTALFGMLTGCASGVTVVNIDNGFGAAMAVARIVFSNAAARGDS